MKTRLYHRWFVLLGMVAMLGALVAMPLSNTYALAMAGKSHTPSAAQDMPCHNPSAPKPCPDCPQKGCPDMSTCMVKCFQQLVPPLTGGHIGVATSASRIMPALSPVAAGTLVPPLLRPPSA
ncbi:hypothetical protein [Hyphomicrobium sp.]|uniref:hypothetical protein n=1 Tax=Hyphomicrobium sp. TaxID=82 RepID=UPI003F718F5F